MNEADKKTLCIIQLSRLGDLLQTLQATSQLRLNNPHLRLILVARKEFVDPLRFLLSSTAGFDDIYALDCQELFSLSENFENTVKLLKDWIATLNAEDIVVKINLTFSRTSALLTSLITAQFCLGMSESAQGKVSLLDQWGQFIYSNIMRGPWNPFSLVDIYKYILGAKETSLLPLERETLPIPQMIALHPFASHAKKAWNVAKWDEIVTRILRNFPAAQIHILGGTKDVEQAQLFSDSAVKNFPQRCFNQVGKLSLEETFTLIKKAQLFVGHDSMGGHLASLAQVPTLTVSLGTVRPIETAPYGNDNYILAPRRTCFPCFPTDPCALYECHFDISHQAVYECIVPLLGLEKISSDILQQNLTSITLNHMQIWQTQLDPQHGMQFLPLLTSECSIDEIFHLYYRVLWNFILRDREEFIPIPPISPTVLQQINLYLEGIEKAFELNGFGKEYAGQMCNQANLATPDIELIQQYGLKINEIDQLHFLLTKSFPLLTPICNYFFVSRSNVQGDSLVEMASNSVELYQLANYSLNILYELITMTLEKYHHPSLAMQKKEASV